MIRDKCTLDKHRCMDLLVTKGQRVTLEKRGVFRIESSVPDHRATDGSQRPERLFAYVAFDELGVPEAADLAVGDALRQLHQYTHSVVERGAAFLQAS